MTANIVADVILTAGIASIIDTATGADNRYDSPVSLHLETVEAP